MTNEAGPNLVYNGLVLHYDAANFRSYDRYENLLLNTSSSNSWINATRVNEPSFPISGMTATRVTDLSTDGDTIYLAGTTITAGTYTASHYIDTARSTSTTVVVFLFLFHSLNGGFTYSNANATFTLSTKSFNAVSYSGPAWSNGSTSVTNMGNGIYRVSITATTSLNSSASGIRAYLSPSPENTSYLIVAGSQYEKASAPSDYYQTTGSAKLRGTSWVDLSSSLNNGTFLNSPTYNSSNNGFIVFDGFDDFINCGNSSSLNVGNNITINSWFYTGSISTYQPIASKVLSDYSLGWEVANSNGVFRATLRPSATQINLTGGSLSLNSWYMGTVTFDNTTLRLYLNGAEVGNTSSGGPVTLNSVEPLRIGSRVQGNFYNGGISQVLIYNRALSSSEIVQNYNATKGRYGL